MKWVKSFILTTVAILGKGSTVDENIISIICEIILLPFKNDNFSNIAIAILNFSLLPLVKLSLLIFFTSFFVSVLCLFFDGPLSKVIALPTIAMAKRSHEPIYKTHTKIEAKGLRATTLLSQSWKSDN